jgi:hypothetical protein
MGREVLVTYLKLFTYFSMEILMEIVIDLSLGHDSNRAPSEYSSKAFGSSLFGLVCCSTRPEIPSNSTLPL